MRATLVALLDKLPSKVWPLCIIVNRNIVQKKRIIFVFLIDRIQISGFLKLVGFVGTILLFFGADFVLRKIFS